MSITGIVLLVLLVLSVPIGIALSAASAAFIIGDPLLSTEVIFRAFFNFISRYSLTAIPLFIFAGFLMERTGLVAQLFRFADSLVLGISEAKEADRQQYLELYRTVENLCIGAGLPMPRVYVIDDSAPNAFATGRDPQHASIAVTKGLLQKMNKLELEGVIGHELSHIGNYDTRLMVISAVLIGFIAIVVDVFLRYTWYGAGTRRRYKGQGEGAGGAILLVLAIVAIVLAPIVARMLQLAISRQREYLADASSALLTRYPEGLAKALEKIDHDTEPLEIATKGTAPLFITNPLKGHESALNNLFETHPPIAERVARLRAMEGAITPPKTA